jgi:hypothetical protein
MTFFLIKICGFFVFMLHKIVAPVPLDILDSQSPDVVVTTKSPLGEPQPATMHSGHVLLPPKQAAPIIIYIYVYIYVYI